MKKNIFLLICLLITHYSYAQSKKLLFETPYGNFKVKLYDFTPHHRDLMLKSIEDDVYKGALFNRVISNFVVQGGEHDIDIEKREAENPNSEKKRFPAEFSSKAFHKVGALGAGRDDNPEKASFLNQIYFIVGKPVNSSDLDKLEEKKGFKFTKKQRKTYLKLGGQPRLDNDYTIFGEITQGLDVIMKISKVKTDKLDYPIDKIPFKVSVIKK